MAYSEQRCPLSLKTRKHGAQQPETPQRAGTRRRKKDKRKYLIFRRISERYLSVTFLIKADSKLVVQLLASFLLVARLGNKLVVHAAANVNQCSSFSLAEGLSVNRDELKARRAQPV